MKNFLAVVMVLCFATVALGQPPERKMTGPEMWRAARMNQLKQIGSEAWEAQKEAMGMKRPGPPPWAGRGMQRGQRGPQEQSFRGRGQKSEVSRSHRGHRGQGWQHRGHKPEAKRGGPEKQNHRGHTKKRGCESCACKDCPNNKK